MQQEYYSQAGMEQAIQELITKTINNERGGFNAMLAPRLVTVDWAAKSCTLAFHPSEWMSNPAGVTHGGILSSIADLAMGMLSIFSAHGAHVTPTANISINYLRPVPLHQDFYVTSTIDHMGRRLNQTHCTMYLPNAPEKPCVTAVGTYYVLDEK